MKKRGDNMEIIIIDNENIDRFEAMMGGANAADVRFDDTTFGLGLVSDDEVYGEVVVELREAAAVIRSLYIVPEHRREGGATLLLLEASAYANSNANVDGFAVEFTEDLEEDNGLKAFFEYCGFELTEKQNITAYSLTLGELVESPFLQEGSKHDLKTYSQLSHDELHKLMEENQLYMPMYVEGNLIEPDVSFFLTNGGVIQGCIVVVPVGDALSVEWMRVSPANYREIIAILRSAGTAAIEKYEAEKQIILPIVSKEADALVNKLFGDKLIQLEKNWNGTMAFEGDFEE